MGLETKVTASSSLKYFDLKPGDVFTWGTGATWYLKTSSGYTGVNVPTPHISDRLEGGTCFEGLRLAKKATLLIEE